MDDQTLRILIDETISRAVSQVRLPKIRFGTTTNTNDLDNVAVLIDGDINPIYAPSLIGPLYDGVRVAVLFNPPSGAMIIGYKYTGQILQHGTSTWMTPDNGLPSLHVGNDSGLGGSAAIEDEDVGIWIFDVNGQQRVYIGTIDAGAGAMMQYMTANEHSLLLAINNDLVLPFLPCQWNYVVGTTPLAGTWRVTTNSGSFIDAFRTIIPNITGAFETSFFVEPTGGTTGELRYTAQLLYDYYARTSTGLQTVATHTGINTGTYIWQAYSFPDLSTHADDRAIAVEVTAQIRVSAGAGSVSCGPDIAAVPKWV